MSRPSGTEIPLDAAEVEKLCSIGCTQQEIADWFGVSLSTIEKRAQEPEFRGVMAKGYARMKISLRRKQIQLADDGDRTMLIWLGKQHLGQRDRFDSQITGKDGAPLISLEHFDSRMREAAERAREEEELDETPITE